MAVLRIYQWPEPILRTVTKRIPIFPVGDEMEHLIADLRETMWAHGAAGIGANQVGFDVRICVIDPMVCEQIEIARRVTIATGGKPREQAPIVLINPTIEFEKAIQPKSIEACLSFPGVQLAVRRHGAISVTAQDVTGAEFVLEARGMLARAIQHEVDHLDGLSILDRVPPMTKHIVIQKLKKRDALLSRVAASR